MQPSSAAVAGASRRCPRKSFTFPSAEHESELEELAWWAAGCDAAASQAHLPAQRSCSDSCCDASSMAARAHSFSSSHSRSRSGRMSSSSFTSGCLSSGSSFTSQGDLWALRHASDTLLREASSASAFSVASSVTGHVMPAAATPSGELLMLPAAGVDAAWAGPAGPSPDVSEAIAAIEAEMAAVAQLRKLQAQRRAAIARVLAGTAASGAPALAAPAPSFPATMHGVTAAAEQLQHLLQALSM